MKNKNYGMDNSKHPLGCTLCVFCFCFCGWFSAFLIALVDIETEPAFLVVSTDWVLSILGDGGGDKENQPVIRIHRARNATLCSSARYPGLRVCGADLAAIPGPQRPPRARRTVSGSLLSPSSGIQTGGFRDSRGARQPLPRPLPSHSDGAPATSPAERRPISPATVGEPRSRRSAGCGPRRARGLGRSAAPGTSSPARPNLSAPASAPAGGERDPPPFHFAPVRGNLRSVTRILKRATCSAGRAALGGIAGLGRRGLGTPGSGGHAGVGAPWRPAAAVR